jgi:hypothetical protein
MGRAVPARAPRGADKGRSPARPSGRPRTRARSRSRGGQGRALRSGGEPTPARRRRHRAASPVPGRRPLSCSRLHPAPTGPVTGRAASGTWFLPTPECRRRSSSRASRSVRQFQYSGRLRPHGRQNAAVHRHLGGGHESSPGTGDVPPGGRATAYEGAGRADRSPGVDR